MVLRQWSTPADSLSHVERPWPKCCRFTIVPRQCRMSVWIHRVSLRPEGLSTASTAPAPSAPTTASTSTAPRRAAAASPPVRVRARRFTCSIFLGTRSLLCRGGGSTLRCRTARGIPLRATTSTLGSPALVRIPLAVLHLGHLARRVRFPRAWRVRERLPHHSSIRHIRSTFSWTFLMRARCCCSASCVFLNAASSACTSCEA